jgi:5'-3' exonuclease
VADEIRVHLVDGTYELFRAFFGAPAARGPAGTEVGATRAILRSLAKLLRDDQVTHIACAFDHVIESFRNDLFDGYKTGEGLDPDLLAQFPLAERASHALGIVTWPMIEFEADDALATAAARLFADPRVARVLICSPDKDLAQCVRGSRVVCVDRLRGRAFDEAGVAEKFGVAPGSIPDLLALVGDNADGVPGIPGWGARSAAALLGRYARLEDIPAAAGEWDVKVRGAQKLADTLRARSADALFYRRLTTLRTDVPIAESLEDLEWHGARRDELEELCRELGDATFVPTISRFRS